ncbi:hypothetical protein WDR10_11160 [Kurthia gibsonii]|uniref:hypothetical protein n=1 Tax=Kurthia gibsonii TaxID=33946 RepID=UPI0030D3DE52
MDKYTEVIKTKTREDKLELTLVGNREYLYSGWEINQVMNRINNGYYKSELINTIKSKLNLGIDPKNIYIMSESIKLNKTYSNVREGILNISSEEGLLQFYYLGKPTPLLPNLKAYRIKYIFEIFEEIQSLANTHGINAVNKKGGLFYLLNHLSEKPTEKEVKRDLKFLLYGSNEGEIKKDTKVASKIATLIDKPQKIYDKYTKILTMEEEALLIEEDLINEFQSIFNGYDKPVICIENDGGLIEILCIDMVAQNYFREMNSRFLETKQIKQNSPLLITIGICLGFVPSILKIRENFKDASETRRAIVDEYNQVENEVQRVQQEIDEQNKLLEAMEVINKTTVLPQNSNDEVRAAYERVEGMEKENEEKVASILITRNISIDSIT